MLKINNFFTDHKSYSIFFFQYSGINRQFDTSAMAKACEGFTIGAVLATINEVDN